MIDPSATLRACTNALARARCTRKQSAEEAEAATASHGHGKVESTGVEKYSLQKEICYDEH